MENFIFCAVIMKDYGLHENIFLLEKIKQIKSRKLRNTNNVTWWSYLSPNLQG